MPDPWAYNVRLLINPAKLHQLRRFLRPNLKFKPSGSRTIARRWRRSIGVAELSWTVARGIVSAKKPVANHSPNVGRQFPGKVKTGRPRFFFLLAKTVLFWVPRVASFRARLFIGRMYGHPRCRQYLIGGAPHPRFFFFTGHLLWGPGSRWDSRQQALDHPATIAPAACAQIGG